MSIKYRQAFRAAMTCRKLKEDQNPVVKFTTFNTSTTNLITSSYLGCSVATFLQSVHECMERWSRHAQVLSF